MHFFMRVSHALIHHITIQNKNLSTKKMEILLTNSIIKGEFLYICPKF